MVPLILAGMQLANGYFASQNIKATAELNRDISKMNAEFAELDAYDAELEGGTQAARYQSVIDNTLADQSAIMAAKDIDSSYGSAASIAKETSFIGQLNLMEIQKNAQQTALGYKRQARDTRLQGFLNYGQDQARAASAMASGINNAVNTGISGYSRRGGYGGGGDNTPGNGIKDSFGGDTQESLDYMNM